VTVVVLVLYCILVVAAVYDTQYVSVCSILDVLRCLNQEAFRYARRR